MAGELGARIKVYGGVTALKMGDTYADQQAERLLVISCPLAAVVEVVVVAALIKVKDAARRMRPSGKVT